MDVSNVSPITDRREDSARLLAVAPAKIPRLKKLWIAAAAAVPPK